MSVHLLIKSPNQEVDDFEVNCDSTWSVGQLKDHLYATYPTKPKQSQQKIIYGGKVLPDHLLLKEVLVKNLDFHTMHLVCPHSTYSSSSSSSASVKLEQDKHASPELQNAIPTVVQDDGLRQRFWNAQMSQFNMPASYFQGQVPQVGVAPMSYQFAMMQQAYAQIMAQFLAQNQLLYGNVPMQPPSPVFPAQPIPEPVEHIVNRPEAPAVRNVNRHEHRDLLETLYILSRLFLLCAIVYFYSTPGKVMLVFLFGLLVCIFRTFANTRPHNRSNLHTHNGRERPNTGANTDQVPVHTTENPNSEAGNNQETLQEDTNSSTNASGNGFSPITFVKAFFTSLIPEHPVPIET